MARTLVLWGDENSQIVPNEPGSQEELAERYVRKCVEHGVTRLIPGAGTKVLIDAAHNEGLEVQTYNGFNHNGNMIFYTWSLDYVLPLPYTREARKLLDRHRPIWRGARTQEIYPEFARARPEYWAHTRETRERKGELRPGERLSLSLAVPDVRAQIVKENYLSMLDEGPDGIQVEFATWNAPDEHGVVTHGYEEPMLEAFEKEHGRSALGLPNDDANWVRFRAGYVTTFLDELRQQLKQRAPEVKLTTTLRALEPDEYVKHFWDWPTWVDQEIIDEFYLWFRDTSDLGEVERQTRHASEVIDGRCPLVVELSCYHVGSFQDPDLLLEAARRARANGADAVGVYGSDPIEQLELWSVLEEMGRL